MINLEDIRNSFINQEEIDAFDEGVQDAKDNAIRNRDHHRTYAENRAYSLGRFNYNKLNTI